MSVQQSQSLSPEVWVMLQPPLEVAVPLLQARERDERLPGAGPHLAPRHREAAREVEQVLHHLLAELHEGGHLGRLRHGGRGLTLDVDQRLHGDAHHGVSAALLAQAHEAVRDVEVLIRTFQLRYPANNSIKYKSSLECYEPEDGGGFVVVDGAQQLPGLAAPRLGPAEVHGAAHAVREGDGA